MASWPSFNLTTVRQPVRSMVDASVEDLISRINTPEKPPNHKEIMGEYLARYDMTDSNNPYYIYGVDTPIYANKWLKSQADIYDEKWAEIA